MNLQKIARQYVECNKRFDKIDEQLKTLSTDIKALTEKMKRERQEWQETKKRLYVD